MGQPNPSMVVPSQAWPCPLGVSWPVDTEAELRRALASGSLGGDWRPRLAASGAAVGRGSAR
jgi:hypothetical protein